MNLNKMKNPSCLKRSTKTKIINHAPLVVISCYARDIYEGDGKKKIKSPSILSGLGSGAKPHSLTNQRFLRKTS